mgnify:FL=1
MKVYLVGGAIRDKLLGLEPKEKDWVVVGSTPNEMKENGFKQVGKDFPVFIHPKSGEEYALARTERKSGHGYTGFEFNTDSSVTLEEDLERRDLTINAIAEDEFGNLIDPFKGQEDITNKKLRHVSDAFSEDPLRVLRLARFKVKFSDFSIVPETVLKVREIVNSGELNHLTGERIWLELYKSDDPFEFHKELALLGAAETIGADFIYNPVKHKEMMQGLNPVSKFHKLACFIHAENISSEGKIKIPNEYRDLSELFEQTYNVLNYEPDIDKYEALIDLVNKLDIRKTERLNNFLECLENKSRVKFLINFIERIKSFKLKKDDQNKSNNEIVQIVKNSHRKIAQDYLRQYLDTQQN